MATKPASGTKVVEQRGSGLKAFVVNGWRNIDGLFDMPERTSSTLPEAVMARLGFSSWLVGSLMVSSIYYLGFLIVAYLDGFAETSLVTFTDWRISLIPPAILLYALLVIPVLRQQLSRSIGVYRAMVPPNDRFRRLEEEAYSLRRRREWLAVGLGTLLGWLFLEPPWEVSHYSALMYELVGDVLVFGLAGWHIYAALSRTKLLANSSSNPVCGFSCIARR